MKAMLKWTLVPGAFMVLACQNGMPSEDLRDDLALLDAIQVELAPTSGGHLMVVSAAEKVHVPGSKAVATPTRKRAPKAPPPQEAEAEAGENETATAPEVVAVAPSDAPTAVEDPAPEAAPAVRPRPIEPRFPVGGGMVVGTGRDRGTGGGGVGVVIRGGRTGRDPCAIHDRPVVPPILINDRVWGRPTFPRG